MSVPLFVQALDLVGIFVFALSGGVLAVRHRLDLFGVLVLAGATAVTGGIVRDVPATSACSCCWPAPNAPACNAPCRRWYRRCMPCRRRARCAGRWTWIRSSCTEPPMRDNRPPTLTSRIVAIATFLPVRRSLDARARAGAR